MAPSARLALCQAELHTEELERWLIRIERLLTEGFSDSELIEGPDPLEAVRRELGAASPDLLLPEMQTLGRLPLGLGPLQHRKPGSGWNPEAPEESMQGATINQTSRPPAPKASVIGSTMASLKRRFSAKSHSNGSADEMVDAQPQGLGYRSAAGES